jgi:hypothetical protein
MATAPPIELRRAEVPADRVLALWTSIVLHRDVLEGECANPVMHDGGTRSIDVHANGTDSLFVCSNATTPEFDEVHHGFAALVLELLPPPHAGS